MAALLCCLGCSAPRRPAAVPSGATHIDGAKKGYWQVCHLSQRTEVHCTVWNDGGVVLKDETYLPLDEGSAPQDDDLKIRVGEICSGPYQVCLTNGRILLPESQFEQLRVLMKKYAAQRR